MHEKVPIYANAWFIGARTPEHFAEKAKYTVSKGVKALKWDPFGKAHMTLTRHEMDEAVACVGAVRDAVGWDVELLIECHGRFNHFTAVNMSKELAQFSLSKKPHCIVAKWLLVVGEDRKAEKVATCGGRVS